MAYLIDRTGNPSAGGVVLVPNHQLKTSVNPNLVLLVQHQPRQLHNRQLLVPVPFAFDPAMVAQVELERSVSLQQFMNEEGLVPSVDEEFKRMDVIEKLKKIVMTWIKRVAYQRRLTQNQFRAASATILTYGSYGLGVHSVESDIDALCVGPWFASMAEDFFIVLRNMLARRPEVSDIQCVKDAKVPLMRFKFHGISIDLPYAQLKVTAVSEDIDILNPMFLNGIDETSWKSLSGVRANTCILQLVSDVKMFRELLRCVKLWAKRRGVYGNLFGFFGGVHLAVLVAFICQRSPSASLATLISIFFKTYASWPWPRPVVLQEGLPLLPPESRLLMPIQLPSSPQEYCHSNISTSTFHKIRVELLRGHRCTQELLMPQFGWRNLFEPFPYPKTYLQFVKICLSASNQEELGGWVGWVKSRFRCLLVKLEEVYGFCDPNPTEYVDTSVSSPNVVFYWGLAPGNSNYLDLDAVEEDFMKNLSTGYHGCQGQITLSIVEASELPKNLQLVDAQTKSHWRFSSVNHHQQMVPVYSNHLPHYVVGYLVTKANTEQPTSGVLG